MLTTLRMNEIERTTIPPSTSFADREGYRLLRMKKIRALTNSSAAVVCSRFSNECGALPRTHLWSHRSRQGMQWKEFKIYNKRLRQLVFLLLSKWLNFLQTQLKITKFINPSIMSVSVLLEIIGRGTMGAARTP